MSLGEQYAAARKRNEQTPDGFSLAPRNRPGTKGRNIRIPDDLWDTFRQLAEERGTTASAEIVAFVRRYVRRHQA